MLNYINFWEAFLRPRGHELRTDPFSVQFLRNLLHTRGIELEMKKGAFSASILIVELDGPVTAGHGRSRRSSWLENQHQLHLPPCKEHSTKSPGRL